MRSVLERREWGDFYGIPVAPAGEQAHDGGGRGRYAVWRSSSAACSAATPCLPRSAPSSVAPSARSTSPSSGCGWIAAAPSCAARSRRNWRRELAARRTAAADRVPQLEDASERSSTRGRLAAASGDARIATMGSEVTIRLADIVKAWQPNDDVPVRENRLLLWSISSTSSSAIRARPTPRAASFPAIFGTVVMVLVMSVIVTPFGILAAIYLREYARAGRAAAHDPHLGVQPCRRAIDRIRRVRIWASSSTSSVGLIDNAFFPEALPAPTFGTPGLFWASLTLALLTLPVVIVSTEEGLARIPVDDPPRFAGARGNQGRDALEGGGAAGHAGNDDRADPGHRSRRRRGGAADAGGCGQARTDPAD
jgi:phosphate transport system permease protein